MEKEWIINGDKNKPDEPKNIHDLILPVFKTVTDKYSPSTFKDCDCHFTTDEIFWQMQQLYPSGIYDAADVYDLLIKYDFKPEDISGGRMEWPMKRVQA